MRKRCEPHPPLWNLRQGDCWKRRSHPWEGQTRQILIPAQLPKLAGHQHLSFGWAIMPKKHSRHWAHILNAKSPVRQCLVPKALNGECHKTRGQKKERWIPEITKGWIARQNLEDCKPPQKNCVDFLRKKKTLLFTLIKKQQTNNKTEKQTQKSPPLFPLSADWELSWILQIQKKPVHDQL